MLMRVMNTDRDGDGNNMFSSYDVIQIWRIRYWKVMKLIAAYKEFSIMALIRILRQVISLNKKGKPVNTVGVYLAENYVRCIVK